MVSRQPDDQLVAERPTAVLTGISKSFAGVQALTDVTIEILPGEIHALLGENGAGKSTLMGIASGQTDPDEGEIEFEGFQQRQLTPTEANALGISIVHQHPALLPDMTVEENLRLGISADHLRYAGSEEASMRALLDEVGMAVHLHDRVDALSIANKHLLEVAKALAASPKMLILDEPTAPLGKESVDRLFEHVRVAAGRGTAVVYITHRLAEVRVLADRVTVLRDGKVSGTALVNEVTDDQLLAWIVGRRLIGSTFPEKASVPDETREYLRVEGLTGDAFADVSLTARQGEIVGIAGVVGNGQSELLAALAGLEQFTGTVEIAGNSYAPGALRTRSAYMPADRHREGLMMTLSVRENSAVRALVRFRRQLFVRRRVEVPAVARELASLDVRAPSLEASVTSLSGGNQQKVVMARALLSQPLMLIADQPTQGVDVGARAEIYRILREVAQDGIPVVVASSDAHELEGLCDRVVVMSRGHVVMELAGEEVTEQRVVHAAVSATGLKDHSSAGERKTSSVRRFFQGDYAPVLILALVILGLAGYIYSGNDRYFSAFNITSVLTLVSALGFIAIGQTVALLVAGIDLSVGPLAGFLVVVGSFFLVDGNSFGIMILGLVAMAVVAVVVGGVNGSLVRFLKFTPVAATLTTYIALGGLAFVVRDRPGGFISGTVTSIIMAKLGPVPWAFIALVAVTFAMEYGLRRGRWGHRIRAIGSSEDSARRLGIPVDRVALSAYVATSVFVFFGAIVLLALLGIGDPAQGAGFTLSSVTAVVLGGTSLLGGRGTYIGTLLGALLIVQVQNATVFLGLSQTWQYFFQGALIMASALIYSQVRGLKVLR